MKKIFLIVISIGILITLYQVYHLSIYRNSKIFKVEHNSYPQDDMVDAIYGKNGLYIDLENILYIRDLVELVYHSTYEEQQLIATLVIEKLQKQAVHYITDDYIVRYLQKFALQSYPEYIDESIWLTAQKLFDYIIFEREHILANQKNRFIFLQVQQNFKLPELMSFWSDQQGRDFLNAHNINYTDGVVVQDMMSDMAIFLGAQMGAELANEQLADQATDLANILNQQSQTIQATMKNFQTQAQTDQQKKLQQQITDFSNKGKEAQQNTQKAIDASNQELNYLYKNISLNKPQQQYLSSPIIFDQIFAQGDMLTPEGYVWKNPFSVGDWEYVKEDDSFYQCQISSIFSPDSQGKSSSIKAENNSIFTEYVSNKMSYTIKGLITIYKVEYPFFVGIIFNKARWISGDYQSLRKSRMVGIYGKNDTDIGVYFAEQYVMTDQQLQLSQNQNPIQEPLDQILNGGVHKQFDVDKNIFKDLKKNPIIFNFEITTTPKKVTFLIWNDKNNKKEITVDNLNQQMFLYHGVGYISPGAIAQFKIQEPVDLLFSKDALDAYKD